MSAARRTPLIAALPKMVFPFLVDSARNDCDRSPSSSAPGHLPARMGSTTAGRIAAGKGLIPPKIDETTGQPVLDSNGKPILDYDLAVPNMLLHYFPSGILGLGLTALLASFMSGMAGNVTAFNTVWTYDIYQSYIHQNASDAHYLWMGRMATVFGIALSVAAAYAATALQQHHGLSATGVRVRERSVVCDIPAGDVLEAHDRARRFLRVALGNGRGGRSPWPDACPSGRLRASKAAGWQRCPHLSQRNGSEFLDCDLGVVGLFGDHHSG